MQDLGALRPHPGPEPSGENHDGRIHEAFLISERACRARSIATAAIAPGSWRTFSCFRWPARRTRSADTTRTPSFSISLTSFSIGWAALARYWLKAFGAIFPELITQTSRARRRELAQCLSTAAT